MRVINSRMPGIQIVSIKYIPAPNWKERLKKAIEMLLSEKRDPTSTQGKHSKLEKIRSEKKREYEKRQPHKK